MVQSDILIDVSRLIWRTWRGGLPTGIDRVCLAYVEHFRGRARAVVQRGGRYYVFTAEHSDLLFEYVLRGPGGFQRAFMKLGLRAFPAARRKPDRPGMLYFNIGHTGLDEPTLIRWIAESGSRAVYLIHDLIPLLHPEFCRASEQAKHRIRMRNVLQSAYGIIGNSVATINDVASFAQSAGLPMPPAIAALIAGPPVPAHVAPRHFDRPHFITVGTIEGRKNHALLLHVWQRLAASHGPKAPLLVIVGQRGWEASQAIAMLDRAFDLKPHVIEHGDCGDDELAALIAGSRALLMPSFAEGYGLPIAEALELGTPVIASDLGVFREFAGDIPTYLDPLDGPGWASAIVDFATASPERERQIRTARDYQGPNWKSHFEVVEAWLQTLS